MNTSNPCCRRRFLKSAVLVAAAPALVPAHVWGAETAPSNRITLGFIGMGTQGRGLMNGFLGKKETQVVAVCDVDTNRRDYHAKMVDDRYAKESGSGYQGCAKYGDFRELLGRKDIDAVVIATPDHWHALPVIAAADAGKDIYCEKPLSLTIAEARAMVKAVRRNDRVFQTGSMQRSSREFRKACELVRNGRIGKIREIYISIGGPSKWCDLPEEPMEPGLDWDFWLGPAPMRPYNSVLSPRRDAQKVVHQHFPNWRSYREYSGGGMTDWGAHHYDIAQWGLGMDESGPVEVRPPDGKDVKRLTFTYANGVKMYHGGLEGYGFGVVFVGENGKICVDRGRFKAEPESIEETPLTDKDVRLYSSNDHLQDFVNCIRSRKKPICDVETGCRTVTVCHLANLALWNKRVLKWDPAKEEFEGDAEANSWRDRERRAPWQKMG